MNLESDKKHFELQSLKHLLQVESQELAFLDQHSSAELLLLKNQILQTIQEGQKEIFVTMAKVSRYMPNFLNAKVSMDILGPNITANLSYYLSPKDAIGIATHFPIPYFCDVIEHLIPEKISEMIRLTPFDQMRKAVYELIRRKNFFVIGSLIDFTPIDSVDKIARGIEDPKHLIHITYNCQDKKRVLALFEKFGEKRIFQVVSAGLDPDAFQELKTIYEYADLSLISFTREVFRKESPELISQVEGLLPEKA